MDSLPPSASRLYAPNSHPQPGGTTAQRALLCSPSRRPGSRGRPEMLQFLSQWLARDSGGLGAALEDFAGHPAYAIG